MSRLLRGVRSIGDVINRLGKPDRRYGPTRYNVTDKTIWHARDIRRSLQYFALAKTLNVEVVECMDGKVRVGYWAKEKVSLKKSAR